MLKEPGDESGFYVVTRRMQRGAERASDTTCTMILATQG